jgi:uncharacterized small protein (DUF1192 family)
MAVRPASRGGDGTMYGLITFAILTVASLGAFVWQLTINDDLKTKAESAQKRLQSVGTPPGFYMEQAGDRTSATDVMNQSIQGMAQIITGKPEAVLPAVQEEAGRLMAELAKNTGGKVGEKDALVSALRKLGAAYQQLVKEKSDLQARHDELATENQTLANGNSMTRKEFEEQVAALKADVERIDQEKNDTLSAKDRQFTEQQSLTEAQTEEMNRARVERQNETRQSDIASEKLRKQVDDLQKVVSGLRSTGFDATDILTKADGRVLRAIPGSDVVYVDVGTRDRVRAGMTFAIFSPVGERGVTDGQGRSTDVIGKATVEVQAVREGTSECRIVRSTPGKPIIEGDVAVNIAFERDRKTKFVLRGEFDLNYDGEADWDGNEKVSAIIREWGGQVVKDVDETVDFVIIGFGPETPRIAADRPISAVVQDLVSAKKEERAEWLAVIERAKTRNIPVITQTQFLHLTGYGGAGLVAR